MSETNELSNQDKITEQIYGKAIYECSKKEVEDVKKRINAVRYVENQSNLPIFTAWFEELYKKVVRISTVQELIAEKFKIPTGLDELKFPIKTEKDFRRLEAKLETPRYNKKFLSSCIMLQESGNFYRKISSIVADSVLVKYNWNGNNQYKALKDTILFGKVLFYATGTGASMDDYLHGINDQLKLVQRRYKQKIRVNKAFEVDFNEYIKIVNQEKFSNPIEAFKMLDVKLRKIEKTQFILSDRIVRVQKKKDLDHKVAQSVDSDDQNLTEFQEEFLVFNDDKTENVPYFGVLNDYVPLKSIQEVMNLEEKLKNLDFKEAFIKMSRSILTSKKITYIFRNFLSDEVAIHYNWDGIHGKEALKNLRLFNEILRNAFLMEEDDYVLMIKIELSKAHNRYHKNLSIKKEIIEPIISPKLTPSLTNVSFESMPEIKIEVESESEGYEDNIDSMQLKIKHFFPLKSQNEIESLEKKLRDPDFNRRMVKLCEPFVNPINTSFFFRSIMTDAMAIHYNWDGLMGKKSLKNLILFNQVLRDGCPTNIDEYIKLMKLQIHKSHKRYNKNIKRIKINQSTTLKSELSDEISTMNTVASPKKVAPILQSIDIQPINVDDLYYLDYEAIDEDSLQDDNSSTEIAEPEIKKSKIDIDLQATKKLLKLNKEEMREILCDFESESNDIDDEMYSDYNYDENQRNLTLPSKKLSTSNTNTSKLFTNLNDENSTIKYLKDEKLITKLDLKINNIENALNRISSKISSRNYDHSEFQNIFPIKTENEFDRLENRITEKLYKMKVLDWLRKHIGKTKKSKSKSIISQVLDAKLALLYDWEGLNNKNKLSDTLLFSELLPKALRMEIKPFKNQIRKELTNIQEMDEIKKKLEKYEEFLNKNESEKSATIETNEFPIWCAKHLPLKSDEDFNFLEQQIDNVPNKNYMITLCKHFKRNNGQDYLLKIFSAKYIIKFNSQPGDNKPSLQSTLLYNSVLKNMYGNIKHSSAFFKNDIKEITRKIIDSMKIDITLDSAEQSDAEIREEYDPFEDV